MSGDPTLEDLRREAFAHMSAGEPDKAWPIYEATLQETPEDADILGLFALCAYQTGRRDMAWPAWRKSLSLPSPARTNWRNANNFFAALITDQAAQASDLTSVSLSSWPGSDSPLEGDIALARSLLRAMNMLGRGPDVSTVFRPFAGQLDVAMPEALAFLRAVLELGHIDVFGPEIFARLRGRNFDAECQLLLGAYDHACGNLTASKAAAAAVSLAHPIFTIPARKQQRINVAVLNRPPPAVYRPMSLAEFHFMENTPVSFAKQLIDDLTLVSIFPEQLLASPSTISWPSSQIVFNNWATGEILSVDGAVAPLEAVIDRLGLPVLNAPQAVLQTTRQRNAERLQGIRNLVVPRVLRLRLIPGAEKRAADFAAAELGLPLLLREPFQQMGADFTRADTVEDLEASLLSRKGEVYAMQFIENALVPGIYRKFRAAFIGDELFMSHVYFADTWNVHLVRSESKRLSIQAEAVRAAGPAETQLEFAKEQARAPLTELRRRMPLDVFGVDFDIMPDGRTLLFEANAAMNISFGFDRGNIPARLRMRQFFLEFVEQRIAGNG